MKVFDTLLHADTLMSQIWYDKLNRQNTSEIENEAMSKILYNFYLEIKNVYDTSSHDDKTMCQIWYTNVQA